MRKYGGSEFSANRFKRKGFSGHKVNPSYGELEQAKAAGMPRLSNYVRHQISMANRAVKKGKINV